MAWKEKEAGKNEKEKKGGWRGRGGARTLGWTRGVIKLFAWREEEGKEEQRSVLE